MTVKEGRPLFEGRVRCADRGGDVAVIVNEAGEIVIKDCYGELVVDVDTSLDAAVCVAHAVIETNAAREARLRTLIRREH